MEEVIKIKYNEKENRRIMAVRAKKGEDSKVYEVPMPIDGDEFHINGVIYKINYLRDNPFRFSAEPTGQVVLEVIEDIVRQQDEWEKRGLSAEQKDT